MTVSFSKERWVQLQDTYARWWAGELERPLIQVTLTGADPGRPEPELAPCAHLSAHPMDVSAEQIVDRIDWELSGCEFVGDAFPVTWPNFGPGCAAAFMGARVEAAPDTTWFHPPDNRDIRDIHFEYDPTISGTSESLKSCRPCQTDGRVRYRCP